MLILLWLLTLPVLSAPLARVKVPLAPVTAESDAASEQVTQVLLWDPVEVVKVEGDWVQVVVPEQYRTERGYPGWMRLQALALNPSTSHHGPWVTVVYPQVALRSQAGTGAPVLLQVYMSTRLPLLAEARRDQRGESWHRWPIRLGARQSGGHRAGARPGARLRTRREGPAVGENTLPVGGHVAGRH
jgi:hypothetical protein